MYSISLLVSELELLSFSLSLSRNEGSLDRRLGFEVGPEAGAEEAGSWAAPGVAVVMSSVFSAIEVSVLR